MSFFTSRIFQEEYYLCMVIVQIAVHVECELGRTENLIGSLLFPRENYAQWNLNFRERFRKGKYCVLCFHIIFFIEETFKLLKHFRLVQYWNNAMLQNCKNL